MEITRQSLHYFIRQGNKNSFETLIKIADAGGFDVSEFLEVPTKSSIICPDCGKIIEIEVK